MLSEATSDAITLSDLYLSRHPYCQGASANTLKGVEIKTHQFDTYTAFLKRQVIEDQVEELREARAIAVACGYDFVVGVSSTAHRAALLQRDPKLRIVVTGCAR